jgi:glyoxylase-like metal-dependent hydrolase (beta-lactamase superfamily II)
VDVDRPLRDGDVLSWEHCTVTAVATPGHTDGSLSYVVDGGPIRFALVGDLVHAGGRF